MLSEGRQLVTRSQAIKVAKARANVLERPIFVYIQANKHPGHRHHIASDIDKVFEGFMKLLKMNPDGTEEYGSPR